MVPVTPSTEAMTVNTMKMPVAIRLTAPASMAIRGIVINPDFFVRPLLSLRRLGGSFWPRWPNRVGPYRARRRLAAACRWCAREIRPWAMLPPGNDGLQLDAQSGRWGRAVVAVCSFLNAGLG